MFLAQKMINRDKENLRLKVIACGVLRRYISKYVYESQHTLDVDFFEMKKHIYPDNLCAEIQKAIDDTNAEKYDAILLGYGLCGNSIIGLKASTVPIIVPRAHDCCTFFMGSKDAFNKEFGNNKSASWVSDGYYEDSYSIHFDSIDTKPGEDDDATSGFNDSLGLGKTYEEYAEEYGEENAQFLLEMLGATRKTEDLIYISTPETAHLNLRDRIFKQAEEEGVPVREVQGGTKIIERLCKGEWTEDDFLVVEKGKTIIGVYDADEVIKSE